MIVKQPFIRSKFWESVIVFWFNEFLFFLRKSKRGSSLKRILTRIAWYLIWLIINLNECRESGKYYSNYGWCSSKKVMKLFKNWNTTDFFHYISPWKNTYWYVFYFDPFKGYGTKSIKSYPHDVHSNVICTIHCLSNPWIRRRNRVISKIKEQEEVMLRLQEQLENYMHRSFPSLG